uniref:Uncharacterized protein n=1 Tax=Trichuris muris TaxID=70415 RepID=A0A5S6QDS3_TRIMR
MDVCGQISVTFREFQRGSAGDQEMHNETYGDHENTSICWPNEPYSGRYAFNPYSFDYDGHPYYYGCFVGDSDQEETDDEFLGFFLEQRGDKRAYP